MSQRINPWTNESLAYAAGFFDGEGCVSLTWEGTNSLFVKVTIANTNFSILGQFERAFGGKVYTQNFSNNWKTAYRWVVSQQESINFLNLIENYCFVKRDQIVLAKLLWAVRSKTRKPIPEDSLEEYRSLMQVIKDQMNWLNRKGKRDTSDTEPFQELRDSIHPEDWVSREIMANGILGNAGYAVN